MQEKQAQRLLDLLFYPFDGEGMSLFALLDGARDPAIYKTIVTSGLEYECLFSGKLVPALQMNAPYVVRLLPDAFVCQRLIEDAWGNSWGLFLAAKETTYQIRRHLRSFLRVQTSDRKYALFRYYDPRVLRSFLPTCDPSQLRQIFGPIRRLDMESRDGSKLLRFRPGPGPEETSPLRSWTYDLSETDNAADDRWKPVP